MIVQPKHCREAMLRKVYLVGGHVTPFVGKGPWCLLEVFAVFRVTWFLSWALLMSSCVNCRCQSVAKAKQPRKWGFMHAIQATAWHYVASYASPPFIQTAAESKSKGTNLKMHPTKHWSHYWSSNQDVAFQTSHHHQWKTGQAWKIL